MSDHTPNSVSFLLTPNDDRPLPEIIAEQADFPLAYLDHEDGKRYYAVQDWIVGVTGTDNPRTFWQKMKKRFEKVGFVLSLSWVQLPYRATNGRTYQMDYAQAETLYQITQRMDVNTGLRNKVLQFLAFAGVTLDEMRVDPDKALDAGIQAYKRKGKSDKWIETRLQSKAQRLNFTAAFRKSMRNAPQQWHYAVITDVLRIGLWKRTTALLKTEMGLKTNDNLRDHQSDLALAYEILAERLSAYELDRESNLEFDETKAIVRSNSEFVGEHAEEAGRRLGIDVATNRPLLADNT